jgi:tetraacyldisaccharide 4'-kinase
LRLVDRRAVAEAWGSQSRGGAAIRGALLPAAGLFRGIVTVRNRLYDRGSLRARRGPIPAVSVGNLSVGGTGKTPISAWLAKQLALEGAAPGVVMRGYGGDEPNVHRELNPRIPVLLYADRVAGVYAAARAGCDVAVLDDAFQHRRAAREEDIVLLSADSWGGSMALLPAGPWREPLTAVRRATLAMITVKAADPRTVQELEAGLGGVAPSVPIAIARLTHDRLRSVLGGDTEALSSIRGLRVLAVAGIADPEPFFLQLERAGAVVTRRAVADHHAFSAREVASLRNQAERHDMLVCTLKDAVKLRVLWPPGAPAAWYVSQAVTIEHGTTEVASLVRRLLAAREPLQRDTAFRK